MKTDTILKQNGMNGKSKGLKLNVLKYSCAKNDFLEEKIHKLKLNVLLQFIFNQNVSLMFGLSGGLHLLSSD